MCGEKFDYNFEIIHLNDYFSLSFFFCPYSIMYALCIHLSTPQAVNVTTMHSAAILTRHYMRPVDGGVEVCARAVCTIQLGQSVSSVPQATSQTPTAEWTVLMPAYVSALK